MVTNVTVINSDLRPKIVNIIMLIILPSGIVVEGTHLQNDLNRNISEFVISNSGTSGAPFTNRD